MRWRHVSSESPPPARSEQDPSIVDVLGSPQSGSDWAQAFVYWIAMLFMAGVLVVCWFDDDVGAGHPVYALLVTAWAFVLTPGAAIPAVRLVMRLLPRDWFRVPRRARTPPPARRRSLRLAARAVRMESPCRRPSSRIQRPQDRLTLPGTVRTRRCDRPRRLLCGPLSVRRRRTFRRAPVERTVDTVAGCGHSSLPGAATALHHASTPTSVG
jgi:hypothetical protein